MTNGALARNVYSSLGLHTNLLLNINLNFHNLFFNNDIDQKQGCGSGLWSDQDPIIKKVLDPDLYFTSKTFYQNKNESKIRYYLKYLAFLL